jgi:drug/metabolite transporter (DMT)-like permease
MSSLRRGSPGREPPAAGPAAIGPTAALLLAALAFSLMAACVKAVGGRIPVAEVVLARSLVGLALSGWMVAAAGISPWGRRRGLLLLRGLLGSLALACVFAALTLLPLATATVIQYLYPTFAAVVGWWWLGEPIGIRVLLAMALGWVGVVLVCQPAAGAISATGVALALLGALLTALAYGSVRELGRSEHPLVILLYFPLLTLPLSLPWVALDPVLPQGADWLWLIGVGLFTQLGQLGVTHGLVRLPVARATAIGYGQVLFAALWGWLLFGEALAPATLLGACLILAATLLSLPAAPAAAAPSPSAGD